MYNYNYNTPYYRMPQNFSGSSSSWNPFTSAGNYLSSIPGDWAQGGWGPRSKAIGKAAVPLALTGLAIYGGKKLYDKFTEKSAAPQYLPPEIYQQPDMFNPAPMNPEVQANQMTAGIADAESMQRRAQVEAPAQQMIAQQAAAQPNNNVNYYQAAAPKAFSRVYVRNFSAGGSSSPAPETVSLSGEDYGSLQDSITAPNSADTVFPDLNDIAGKTNPFSFGGYLRGIRRNLINPVNPVSNKIMGAAKIVAPLALGGYLIYKAFKKKDNPEQQAVSYYGYPGMQPATVAAPMPA